MRKAHGVRFVPFDEVGLFAPRTNLVGLNVVVLLVVSSSAAGQLSS